MAEQQTPAGWYPDGVTDGKLRYWDGAQWTEHYHELTAAPPEPAVETMAPASSSDGAAPATAVDAASVAGPVTAPSAGKPKKSRKGLWITLGSIGAVILLIIIISAANSGGTGSTNVPAAGAGSTTSAAPATSPSPKPTVDWYAKTYGTFATISESGTSDSVIKLPAGVKAGIITATYSGSDNFAIQGLDANNQSTTDLPVNTIGAYKGVTVFGVGTLGTDASLQVSAEAAWTITITPIDSAGSLPSSGSGDGVYKYDGGASTWSINNTDPSDTNFVVEQYGSSAFPNLAVNVIGNYSGTVPSDAGPSVVVVTSGGTWTFRQ